MASADESVKTAVFPKDAQWEQLSDEDRYHHLATRYSFRNANYRYLGACDSIALVQLMQNFKVTSKADQDQFVQLWERHPLRIGAVLALLCVVARIVVFS